MNINRLRLLSLSLFLTVGALADTPVPSSLIASWKTSTYVETYKTKNRIPDPVANNDLILPETACSVVADKTAPGGKALVFTGQQTTPASSRDKLDLDSDIIISLSAKPTEGAAWQTLVYLYQFVELRYNANRQSLLLIAWPADGGKTVEIACPITQGTWNTISATVNGKELSLTVNGVTAKAALPDDRPLGQFYNKVHVGYGSKRPYTGGLADISIRKLSR